MRPTADLHFHSLHSDGKHSVAWLAETLKSSQAFGLRLAVLTDHDGISGTDEFFRETDFPKIRGCELSCRVDFPNRKDQELHFLLYGLQSDDEFLIQMFDSFKSSRKDRVVKICEKLKAAGYDVDMSSQLEDKSATLGRPHIADALVRLGAARDRAEAFKKFLKDGSRFDVKKWRVPLQDAITHSKKMGYRTSIAHPGQYELTADEIKICAAMGVDAIEVVHPRHTQDQEIRYTRIAKELGLCVSGGSDFHDVQTDTREGLPSLGRATYPLSEAERFLAPFL